jgi:hypothetical protein
MTSLWELLVTLPGHQAVRVTWQHRLGDAWSWARHLLRSTGELATVYPRQGMLDELPSYYRIVCHSEELDLHTGVYEDERVHLRRADRVIYELHGRLLAERIAAALSLRVDYESARGCYRVGWYTTADLVEVPVYLCLPHEATILRDEVARLGHRHRKRCVVLTTHAAPPARKVIVAHVDRAIVTGADGGLSPGPTWAAIVRRLEKRAKPGVPSARQINFRDTCYECSALTARQHAFLREALIKPQIPVERLVHPKHGLIDRKHYVNDSTTRNSISQFLTRLRSKLLLTRPPLPVDFHLDGEFVTRVIRRKRGPGSPSQAFDLK